MGWNTSDAEQAGPPTGTLCYFGHSFFHSPHHSFLSPASLRSSVFRSAAAEAAQQDFHFQPDIKFIACRLLRSNACLCGRPGFCWPPILPLTHTHTHTPAVLETTDPGSDLPALIVAALKHSGCEELWESLSFNPCVCVSMCDWVSISHIIGTIFHKSAHCGDGLGLRCDLSLAWV